MIRRPGRAQAAGDADTPPQVPPVTDPGSSAGRGTGKPERAIASLSSRIAAAFLISLFGITLVVALVEYSQEREKFLARTLSSEIHRADLASERFRESIAELRSDLAILRELPPIQGIVRSFYSPVGYDAEGATFLASWQNRLAHIFEAYLSYHPEYRQVRLIGLANGGRELVRVDRVQVRVEDDGGSGSHIDNLLGNWKIERVANDALQQKKNRDYFRAGLALRPGEIYISNIDLNREYGVIEEPHWPTLRAVTPVYATETGKLFGMVVINIDTSVTLDALKMSASPDTRVYLVNETGDFLIHPDPAKQYGSDLGLPYTKDTEFPELVRSERLGKSRGGSKEHLHRIKAEDNLTYLAQTEIRFDPGKPDRALELIYAIDQPEFLPLQENDFLAVMLAALAAAIALSLIVLGYLRRQLLPLQQMTGAALDIAEGKLDTNLPTSTVPELAPLADAMAELRRELRIRESSPVMMHSIDRNGRLVFVNDFWLKSLGYSRKEVIGRPVFDFMTRASRDLALRRYIPLFLETGEVTNLAYEFVRKDGAVMNCLLSARAARGTDGDIIRSLAVMVDVTQERRIERALRESEENFEKALESSGHGIALVEVDGKITYANAMLDEILNLEAGALIDADFFDLFEADDLSDMRTQIDHLSEVGVESLHLESRMINRNGDRVPVMISLGAIRDKDHTAKHLVVHVTDLSDLRTAEAQFLQAQKMETVGNLTGGLAHDFNNLLGIVMGNLQLLQRRLRDDETLGDYVTEAIEASRRGADLTRQLLAFSRRQTLETRVIQVNDLLTGMERIMSRTLGTHIEVVMDLASDLPAIRIDPAQLESAILNMSINARDAMPDGGTLTITSSFAFLSARDIADSKGAHSGHHVCITVTDTGCGMPPEVLEKVFEPFFTTKETGKGTGLGMSMVYGFIKQSGGHVTAYSELGIGTQIRLYLPATADAVDGKSRGIPDQTTPNGSETILLVDDEPKFATIASEILGGLGYTVITAIDGPNALQVLSAHPDIDLLLTDMIMPGGMNGHQLADEIRKSIPNLPVLLASGFPRDAFAEGRNYPFLQKPYMEEELARAVRAALDDVRHDSTA